MRTQKKRRCCATFGLWSIHVINSSMLHMGILEFVQKLVSFVQYRTRKADAAAPMKRERVASFTARNCVVSQFFQSWLEKALHFSTKALHPCIMAIFQGLLAFAISSLCMADFTVTRPALHAEPVLESKSWWHIGGFCFGQVDGAPVAKLAVSMTWEGQGPLDESAQVYLVAFDGREDRWGAAKPDWETSTCEQKLAVATDAILLSNYAPGGTIQPKSSFAFSVNIRQRTATRDWHYALIACGNVESAPLKLTVGTEYGALSIFAANENFDVSSCPVMPVSWWLHAREDPLFWFLLFAAAITSACFSMALMVCCRLRTRKDTKLLADSRTAELNDVVIGKPCETPEGEITEGHINATQNATQNANVPKEVWR